MDGGLDIVAIVKSGHKINELYCDSSGKKSKHSECHLNIPTSFLVNLKPFVASFRLNEDSHSFPEESRSIDTLLCLLCHDETDTV